MTTAEGEPNQGADASEAMRARVLFGDKTLYLSHTPLFSPPHNDQMILEVNLTKDGANPEARYRDDRNSSGARFYTVKPPAMSPLALEPGASFVADVHRNSYEADGEIVDFGVTVTVKNVVYTQKLDPNTAAPNCGSHYLCFGEPGAFFAAHRITSAPSFDQIVSLTILDETLAQQPMPQPSLMTVPGADDAFSRLQPHDAPKGEFILHPGTRGEHSWRTRITVGSEIFFDDRFLKG